MFYDSDSGTIYYEVHGPENAPAIVFTHGAGLNHGMFNPQVMALRKMYKVITWDMQGHGKSAKLDGNLDISKMVEYMIGIMNETRVDKAVMVGQSLGSWVAQLAAINHPERVAAIVSISGEPIERPVSQLELFFYKMWLALSRLFPGKTLFRWTAKSKTTTEGARRFAEESMTQIGKRQFLRIVAGMLQAGSIKVPKPPHQPILITHGEHEMPKSVIKSCKKWHENVPGSRYVQLPDAGHNGNQDNPEVFNKELITFLEGIADFS